ncbi:hypothetical protein PT2222_300084 [Paraburkholderia tropica]
MAYHLWQTLIIPSLGGKGCLTDRFIPRFLQASVAMSFMRLPVNIEVIMT